MEVIKLLTLTVIIALLSILLKNTGHEYSFILQIAAIVMILLCVILKASSFKDEILSVITNTGVDITPFKILLKALGINIICDVSSSLCRDAGNEGLSKGVELLGKTAVLIISVPLISEIVNICIGFLK